jgi:hypothetical protein
MKSHEYQITKSDILCMLFDCVSIVLAFPSLPSDFSNSSLLISTVTHDFGKTQLTQHIHIHGMLAKNLFASRAQGAAFNAMSR